MKTKRNIFIAFLLNLSFSIFEFIGGTVTGSVAITSDAVHDMGDAANIGIAFLLEKKSGKHPDEKYTYGYSRYSILGSIISNLILLLGSAMVITNAVNKIINPTEINSNSMIIFALFGICVNFVAALFTHGGNSLNQKAVNLHMLEDVLGWVVVLLGAIIIKLTGFTLIDPIMSISVAAFILVNVFKNFREILCIFLEKTPNNINIDSLKANLLETEGVLDIHHIHVRSLNESTVSATMHVVTNEDPKNIKDALRHKLHHAGIDHVTLELEKEGEPCEATHCHIESESASSHAHAHHHHH